MTIKALSMIHQSCVYEHTFFFHLLSLFSSSFFRHVGLFPSHHNRPLCYDGKAEPGGKLQFVFPSEGNRKKVLIYRSHLRASLSFPLLCSFLFFPTPARPEEQMLKGCSHNGADLIRTLQISRQTFPKLRLLCEQKQKYDGWWRVPCSLTHKRHLQNNKGIFSIVVQAC